ncbi:hypothetical protein ACLB2K_016671 [Fragaria x ananassa]
MIIDMDCEQSSDLRLQIYALHRSSGEHRSPSIDTSSLVRSATPSLSPSPAWSFFFITVQVFDRLFLFKVVSLLKDDSTFIQELFARLRSPSTSSKSKKNLVYFLHEFCSLSKSLQMVQQLRLFGYASGGLRLEDSSWASMLLQLYLNREVWQIQQGA